MPHLLVERLRLWPLCWPSSWPCTQRCFEKEPPRRLGAAASSAVPSAEKEGSGSWWRPPYQPSGTVDCIVEAVETTASFIFLIGSVCFLPGYSGDVQTFLLGCELFVLGAVLLLFLSVFTMLEAFRARGWGVEASEHVLYFVGCILFVAGTILYWPEEVKHTRIEWMKDFSIGMYLNLFSPEFEGTLLFIAGSLLFALAALLNGLSSNAFSKGARNPGGKLLLASATLYLTGSVLFVIGSVLWLPDLGFGPRAEAIGAWIFVIGSAAYVLGGVLSILRIAGYLGSGCTAGVSAAPAAAPGEASPLLPSKVPGSVGA